MQHALTTRRARSKIRQSVLKSLIEHVEKPIAARLKFRQSTLNFLMHYFAFLQNSNLTSHPNIGAWNPCADAGFRMLG